METLETVLLLALPASGKSEVRRYLAQLSPDECRRDFHMGPTVQLDDFPYVHLMRRIDDELAALGRPRPFFKAADRPMQDARDWGTLIELINEDYADLVAKKTVKVDSAARWLFGRIDAAGQKVGLPARLTDATAIEAALEKEAREFLVEKEANYPATLEGRTLVIEFARGGPDGSSMPLPAPLGYQHSLSLLSPEILKKASILYVWVTPEESRRKNQARTDPNDPGSILHHGVPLEVMLNDYGCDDMSWLDKDGVVSVGDLKLPIARFDNRVDKTSFLRNPREEWKPLEVHMIHEGLKGALTQLHRART